MIQKKISLFLVLCCSVISLSMAQEQDVVKEDKIIQSEYTQVDYDGGSRPCLKYIVDIDAKRLKKYWSKFVKDSYSASVKEKESKYLSTKDLVIHKISEKRMDLVAVVFGGETNSVINFAGAFGYDIYFDKEAYSSEIEALQQIAEAFLYNSSNLYYHEEMADLTNDIAKLNKKNEKLTLENTELEAKGVKLTADINTLKESENATSSKVLKKISKLSKKKVSVETNIAGHNGEIVSNNKTIEGLKEKVARFKARQELLNSQQKEEK